MTQPPFFPQLPGQGWSVHKRPTFSTRVIGHVSGREVRSALYAAPLYAFELTFDALAATAGGALAGAGANSLQTLLGFYLARRGQYGTFLYVDPGDCLATAQPLGTGDGVATTFVLQRTMGAATEPVSYATRLDAAYAGGAAQGAVLVAPNLVRFAAPPAAGAPVAASFAHAFLCRFTEDQQDFENVMAGLWTVSSLKFRSVRA